MLVNLKNYAEATGARGGEIAEAALQSARAFRIKIAIAPPGPALALYAKEFPDLPVYAQHVDGLKVGKSTGATVPEILQRYGICGVILNHSERRISLQQVAAYVGRLGDLDMESIVCVRTSTEADLFARFEPTYIAIEPPELIGSGRSISMVRPELIRDSFAAVRRVSKDTGLLIGAGIGSARDISIGIGLGGGGVLLSSAMTTAEDPFNKMDELAGALKAALKGEGRGK